VEAQSRQLTTPSPAPIRPVRVVIDGRKIGDGGIGVYIENLVSGLLEIGTCEVTVIAKRDVTSPLKDLVGISWLYDDARPYSVDELLFLPKRLDLSRFDIFHAPHYTLPFRISIPTIVTVHDLIHITNPERFYYPFVARRLIGSALKRARAVIAVSESTRSQLIQSFGVAAQKVSFVPNAVARFVAQSSGPGEARAATSDPYLLAVVSTHKPHKGVRDLLESYRLFRMGEAWRSSKHLRPPRLVVAGYASDACRSAFGEVEGVDWQGPVSSEELGRLYREAHAVIVASLAEGFCLPALEARAVGTPVVCRPVAAIQELVGSRDVVATDFSCAALAAAIEEGFKRGDVEARLTDPSLHERYSRLFLARQVLDIYRGVVNQGVTSK
jgi:glycosyltransferase involved in cell wall biosynthesis